MPQSCISHCMIVIQIIDSMTFVAWASKNADHRIDHMHAWLHACLTWVYLSNWLPRLQWKLVIVISFQVSNPLSHQITSYVGMIFCMYSSILLYASLASKSVLKKGGSGLNPSTIFIKFHSTLKVKETTKRERERGGGGGRRSINCACLHDCHLTETPEKFVFCRFHWMRHPISALS